MIHDYPRPQLRRAEWSSLNGPWKFTSAAGASCRHPRDVEFDHTIIVPYAPETSASGIADTGFHRTCWYARDIEVAPVPASERFFLHFGAVDYRAEVWLDGSLVAQHEGGYTPFTADLTEYVRDGGTHTIVVCAEDDPAELAKPRGKQDWQREPHSIWYPRTSGIWQTVWTERVPATHLCALSWRSNLERWEIEISARVAGPLPEGLRLSLRLSAGARVLVNDDYAVLGRELERRIALTDPGIDDSRNELLWSPESPTLIRAELELRLVDGTVLDRVSSYTALRAIGVQGDRFLLNGRPYPLRMVLDQGYWPDTGLTPPGDEALRRDVQLAKAMGFNGVRKHQKIEDPRFLFWADRLGLLVWEEMPSAYRFTRESVERLTRQWLEALARDASHPCIVAWVPFNESWGVPNLPERAEERHYIESIYHLTRTIDPSRPVIGNDGWESVATDIIGIHDYDVDPEHHLRRYGGGSSWPAALQSERPGGRLLVLSGQEHAVQPLVLSEFGGITCSPDQSGTWGYSRSPSADDLSKRYLALLTVVRSLGTFCGFCYTQFADTYQEANGLLSADRVPKFPLEQIRAATQGRIAPSAELNGQTLARRASESPRKEGHFLDD